MSWVLVELMVKNQSAWCESFLVRKTLMAAAVMVLSSAVVIDDASMPYSAPAYIFVIMALALAIGVAGHVLSRLNCCSACRSLLVRVEDFRLALAERWLPK